VFRRALQRGSYPEPDESAHTLTPCFLKISFNTRLFLDLPFSLFLPGSPTSFTVRHVNMYEKQDDYLNPETS
jgi:hypothetical protein